MLVRVPIARGGCWFTVLVHGVGAQCGASAGAVSVLVLVLVCCARRVRKSGHRHRHELRPVLRRPARSGLQSIILPVHNAERWLHECLRSVLQQDFAGPMELSVFNDASKDQSLRILEEWKAKLEGSGIPVVIGGHESPYPRGVGYSKNQAIAQSSGSYLCFLDADDVMMPQRVRLQLDAATRHPTSVSPAPVPTPSCPGGLVSGPRAAPPPWTCASRWPSPVEAAAAPHVRRCGGTTTTWTHRVRFLEERVLPHWAAFTIWNAGPQGRRLYRGLSAGVQCKPPPRDGPCPAGVTPGPWELGAVGAGPHPAPLSLQQAPKPRSRSCTRCGQEADANVDKLSINCTKPQ
ncbi:unnamed protein product [Nyctereutes procyonoides]|uniref:(raccoon dog) hypothetical protein n=1 Tax=Nyctereutes procyonoides TaxID=34880 RepID=A0A811XU38_NYCPR|nr:unnamed protein product [Nyctereutes procyonoides]